ncbi:MAG: PAS domain S-box protein [Burkholderiales bacterium]|nr:PAS domain S-box protein [Burkholderiales bacterium]
MIAIDSGTPRAPARPAASLKSRMSAWAATLVALALVIAGGLFEAQHVAALRAAQEMRQEQLAATLAAELAGRFRFQRGQLERFAGSLSAGDLDASDQLRARLASLARYNGEIEEFWVVDAGGIVTADHPRRPGRAGTSVADREYYRRFRANGGFTVSEPSVGRFSGEPRVILLVPLLDPRSRTVGALAGVVKLDSTRLIGGLSRPAADGAGYTGVLSRDGLLLSHSRSASPLADAGATEGAALLLAHRQAVRTRALAMQEGWNAAGIRVIYTVRPVPDVDWTIFAAQPLDELQAQLRRQVLALALVLVLLTLGGGLAAWWMMSRLLAPLAALERAVRERAADPGASSPLPVGRRDEIGRLAETFNGLLRARDEARAASDAAHAQIESAGRMLAILYERSPLGMALVEADGRIARCNPAYLRIVGYEAEELAALTESGLTARGHEAVEAEARRSLDAHGAAAAYEKEYIARNGVCVPVRVSAFAAGDGSGGRTWLLCEDITARRQALLALRESEREARMLAAAASHNAHMVVIADTACRIEWVNAGFTRVTGYSLADVKGRVAGRVLQGPETDPATVAIMREAIAARRRFTASLVNYAKDGRRYWVSIDCTPVFDHQGGLERFVAVERDITAERQAAQALMESESKHRGIFETAREAIWQIDAAGRIMLLNPAWERLTGHAVIDSVGRPFVEFLVAAQRASASAALDALNNGSIEQIDEQCSIVTRDGSARWFEIRGRGFTGADGARQCVGTLHDVHERRQAEASRRRAEEALRQSQERYARAIEAASDVIWERDFGTGKSFVSDRIIETLRMPADAAARARFDLFDRVHPDDRAMHDRCIEAMRQGDDTITWEARFATGDGSYRWLRLRGRAVRDEAGAVRIASGTASDVHAGRVAAEELRAMQVRYQRAMDGSNDGVWERDVASDQFFLSDRFDELLGFAPGAMPRQRDAWMKLVHPDDRCLHDAGVARMLASPDAITWEVRMRTARGEYRWLRFRGIATRDAGGRAIVTSGTASDVHAARLADEELKRHRDNLAQLVEERTAGLELATRDAERQREAAEKARAQADIARQQAVRASLAKSEFLANMSHELRTPMHAIISFANFGVEKADRVGIEKVQQYFQNIQKSSARLLKLLNDLLDLSKLEAGKMQLHRQVTDVAALIDDAIAECDTLARTKDVRLAAAVSGAVSARIDALRVSQVLRNLLSNAIKFCNAGGEVRLECAIVAARGGEPAGDVLEIRVSDSGIGIPEDEMETVFDKFVQSSKTRSGAGGTGLGLAICREIAVAHGGTIRAVSPPPPATGAVLVLRLPANAPPALRKHPLHSTETVT